MPRWHPSFSTTMTSEAQDMNMGGLDYVRFAWDSRLYRCFFVAGLTIVMYDHLLTLPTEVKYIWSSKLRPSTCWFLLVRYAGFCANVVVAVFYFADLNLEMQFVWEFLLVIQEVLIECTLGLRVFAMYGLNLWILACLLPAGGLAAALALWAIIKYGHPKMLSAPGIVGCHMAIPHPDALRLAGAWEAQLLCDTLVVVLTVRAAYSQRRMSPLYRGSLMERMATDGVLAMCVIQRPAESVSNFPLQILLSGFMSWFTTSLSVTLLSRLMLNLHEAAHVGLNETNTNEPDSMEMESLRFPTQRTVPTMIETFGR
ncbi:hypothetical protein FB45DRAFT_898575 [Roridomyces roridus]|uniref:DUF6533 domain-containing protein n=1 Tax=Roridomyces roridus TaxID=1738132 RepID=A0AAD7CCE8_9AGAR|nr:hypothetical protein FB45DRAFT_898575 [Roridomyces roridus]